MHPEYTALMMAGLAAVIIIIACLSASEDPYGDDPGNPTP